MDGVFSWKLDRVFTWKLDRVFTQEADAVAQMMSNGNNELSLQMQSDDEMMKDKQKNTQAHRSTRAER